MRLVEASRVPARDRPAEELRERLSELVAPVGAPDWRAELAWIEDEEMTHLNGVYRGKSGPTDVLSFGNLIPDGDGPAAASAGEGWAAAALAWEDAAAREAAEVGTIAVAPAFVRGRCEANGWPYADELALLVVHGALHLMGWDHEDAASAAAMREAETALLARGGWAHPLCGEGVDGDAGPRRR